MRKSDGDGDAESVMRPRRVFTTAEVREPQLCIARPLLYSLMTLRALPRGLTLILLLFSCGAAKSPAESQVSTEASSTSSYRVQQLGQEVRRHQDDAEVRFWDEVRRQGTPLIEAVPNSPGYSFVTFLWHGDAETKNVVLFDGVAGFEAKDRLELLKHTNVWYKTYRVRNDARFPYNLSPNDSLLPFYSITGGKVRDQTARLPVDPLNPHRIATSFEDDGRETSYVELPAARPLLWKQDDSNILHGKVSETSVPSSLLKADQKIWVYTPAGFRTGGESLPLVVMFNGVRNILWLPRILDLLIAQHRIPPTVAIVMNQSDSDVRTKEMACNSTYAAFLAKEVVPWARSNFGAGEISQRTVIAGSRQGGVQALFTAFELPATFGNAISLSGSFSWNPEHSTADDWLTRQIDSAPKRPVQVYQEVGLMEDESLQIRSNRKLRDVLTAKGYALDYHEYAGNDSLLDWSQGMAIGLSQILGEAGALPVK